LKTLKAVDVMSAVPVTLCETQTLVSAVTIFEKHQITGAPVVDRAGKVVGMISLRDIVRAASTGNQAVLGIGEGTIAGRMTQPVGTVGPDHSLVDVARTMCKSHWHRIPVVGDKDQLLGIISTMDVLAALVNAFDESP